MIIKLIKYFRKESAARLRKRLRKQIKKDFDLMVLQQKFIEGSKYD